LMPALVALRAASSRYAGEAAGREESVGEIGAAGELGSGEAVLGEEIAAGMMIDVNGAVHSCDIGKMMYVEADLTRNMVEAAEGRCLTVR
jgi:hypothetical protein